MADPFLAEIRVFPYTFPPKTWAFCDGQLVPITQNTALFALLGTVYGGDGKSTFALPNLQDSAALHVGGFEDQGPGLSLRRLGESGGADSVSLLQSEIPLHAHGVNASGGFGNSTDPTGRLPARPFGGGQVFRAPNTGATAVMSEFAVAPAGGGLPHTNMMPFLTFHFCIALQGVFPPRQ